MPTPSGTGPLSSFATTSAAAPMSVSAAGAPGFEIGSREINFILSGIAAAIAI